MRLTLEAMVFLLHTQRKGDFLQSPPPWLDGKELLVVIGGGAAGVYGAIRAKTVAPNLNVVVIEKGKPLSKVKISGGGRCNVTNGHCVDKMMLAEHYPRGNKELRGSFFNMHGPVDTMSWFSDHGVELKTEDDGRVFPVSNSSSSIVDCLLFEAKQRGVLLQTSKVVTTASRNIAGNFLLKIEKGIDDSEYVEADYLLLASGSNRQGYTLATQLGHSIVDPVPSLFTFKIKDSKLLELSGVTFLEVKAKLKLENAQRNIPQLTQVGPMLVTHWGLSGPVILRLSAWGARDLFNSGYKGTLFVDFAPHLHVEDMKSILIKRKNQCAKHKVLNSCPSEFGLVKRFWKYILDREGLGGDVSWISVSNNSLISVACLLKQCSFSVSGKGQFKDEFVTAGGVPLSEVLSLSHTHTHTHTNAYIHGHCCVCNCLCRNTKVSLNTMESKIQQHLFFAGEVINIDGVTGGFNFQNAWSGGYIAGTSIGSLALGATLKRDVS
ncbi:uncharacterized protein LOC131143465 isoform X3 [Malania oleifera]|uniref:uncharacterized protein LOC131143465 isoform X3 n=1 Tax=Malania oleifera TaxID=397392 RepID=UPI0025AE4A55|nr:uncharacterized protein LOC131143465 isoform X3 [Malania oleifera]